MIEILTDSTVPKRYWSDLKKKLTKEGSQLYEKIVQLKFVAADGKKYVSSCLDTFDLLRLIQSIPSPKAEPFKAMADQSWLRTDAGNCNPEQSLDHARENLLKITIKPLLFLPIFFKILKLIKQPFAH